MTKDSNKKKILIVEDEFIAAEDLGNNLRDLGYGVLDVVDTGKRALDNIKENRPDLVLMDIKHVDTLSHKRLVGLSMNGLHEFFKYLSKSSVNVWIRHVMVPNMTDSNEIMDKLYDLTKSFKHLVEKFEILPYHKLGVEKYSQLGVGYTLSHLPEMDSETAKEFEYALNDKLRLERTQIGKIKKCAM